MSIRITVFTITSFLFLLGTIQGATIYVPDDHPSIQAAINAASTGDTIIVRPGTYVQNINFAGKAITLTSEQGPEVTVIDGSQPDDPDYASVVTFQNGEGLDSVLDGFGITKGSGSYWAQTGYYYGGGIYCDASSPTITNNIIYENTLSGLPGNHGGGIYCRLGSPDIINNTVSQNEVSGEGAGIFFWLQSSPNIENNIITENLATRYGGGILYFDSCSPTIVNNSITYNTTTEYGGGGIAIGLNCSGTIKDNTISHNSVETHGGGIYIERNSKPSITNNIISENTANSDGAGILFMRGSSPWIEDNIVDSNHAVLWGGGIECWKNCSGTILNNIITNNTVAEHDGGGIVIANNSTGTITNNVIAGNSASKSGGGGVYCETSSSPTLINNTLFENTAKTNGGGIKIWDDCDVTVKNTILWNNDAPTGPEIWVGDSVSPSTLTINYSDVQGGESLVYVDSGCTLDWGDGMFDADPQFEHPAGDDFHLTWTSPCINRGTNDGAPAEDMDGDLRPCVGTVDVGADEFTDTHPLEASVFEVSEATGGMVYFAIAGDTMNAGRNYLILGSVSGTAPGTPLPGGLETLRVNMDWFTDLELLLLGTPIFQGFLGKMDVWGNAAAQLNLPPLPSGTAGITMHYAYCCNSPFDFVSNPVAINIVP
jgi:parallel beta-helix repeat protein